MAQKEILISSPELSWRRVSWLLNQAPDLFEKGVKVSVYTLNAESYSEEKRNSRNLLISMLKESGIWVAESTDLHEHFSVIDRETVWYGSANLLSDLHGEDDMIRMADQQIAQVLLESITGA